PLQSDFAADGKRAGTPWLGMRIADIKHLDAALVVGAFLRKDQPLLAQRLRLAAKKNYTQVSQIGLTADDSLISLHANLPTTPSQLAVKLAAVVKAAAELKGATAPAGLESVQTCDTTRAIAKSLVDGEKAAIFLGNAAVQSPAATQLQALALELGKLTGATVGFLGEAANSVGAYAAGAVATSGANARTMFEQPRKAYVLMGVEPEFDSANPQLVLGALKQAKMVVLLSAFKHVPALEYADVMLPVAPFTETAGTFVNTEGRVQSFNGVARAKGDSRPGWKVLRVLGNVLNLEGFDYETSEQVRDAVLGAGAEFAAGLDNGLNGVSVTLPATAEGLQRVADVPIYFADALVRRSPSLARTRDAAAPAARMHADTLAQLGLSAGIQVRVKQGQGTAVLSAVEDAAVPAGCVRVAAAHASTAALGDLFGPISVERA
ncbi:MAG TPA: molybdopterin-dependent oxidoreductase, partial [Rhodocyclaceae bacterium]|nr:molybdopterin-dependent oxidoreductase [Rhodocyclaceae bacterium]